MKTGSVNLIVPVLFVCNANKTKTKLKSCLLYSKLSCYHSSFFFKISFFTHIFKTKVYSGDISAGSGQFMWPTSYHWRKKKFKYIYYKNRALSNLLKKKSFLKIHRSSITNCQYLAPTVSLAFILSHSKTNTEVWKVCASPGAAQVMVEVRPADKMLVCVSPFWGKVKAVNSLEKTRTTQKEAEERAGRCGWRRKDELERPADC